MYVVLYLSSISRFRLEFKKVFFLREIFEKVSGSKYRKKRNKETFKEVRLTIDTP